MFMGKIIHYKQKKTFFLNGKSIQTDNFMEFYDDLFDIFNFFNWH